MCQILRFFPNNAVSGLLGIPASEQLRYHQMKRAHAQELDMDLKAKFICTVGAFVVLSGVASAQSVVFWTNVAGDASSNTPSTILVSPNSTVTLSVYTRTTGVGPLVLASVLAGYTTSTSQFSGATPVANGVTFNSLAWAPAFSSDALATIQGGGAGSGSGSRPYGAYAVSFKSSGDFGTTDGSDVRLFNITLNIGSLAAGTIVPFSLYSANSSNYSSAVAGTNLTEVFPASSATTNLQVVPEPATLAVLGIGALALRRRRK